MKSIRRELRTGLVLATIVAFAAAGVATERGVHQTLLDDLDRSLRERALWIASTAELTTEGLELGFREFSLHEFEPGGGASLLEIWRPDGTVVYRSASLGSNDLAKPRESLGSETLAFERTADGRRVRTVRTHFQARVDPEMEQPPPAPTLLMSFGHDMAGTDALLTRLRLLLAAVGLAAVLLMLVFVRIVVRRSLRPLERIAGEIGDLDPDALSRRVGAAGIPFELEPVVRRLNELLDRLNAAFGRERTFSADIAHELRTPLAGMRTALEVELSRPREAESYQETIRESLSIVLGMQRLVEMLLQLARFDAGLVAAESVELDIAELTGSILKASEAHALARGLVVHSSLERSVRVCSDPALLAAAIRNLLDNAISHADERGQVRVEVALAGDHARFRVSNTGTSLTADDLPRLFERFARGDSARASSGGHYGLGLALVQRIADALRCRMEVRIEPGGKFVFTLDVPRAGPEALVGPAPAGAP